MDPGGQDPTTSVSFDPAQTELLEASYRFKHDPLRPPHRAFLKDHDHINGNPLDWALQLDPGLHETLIAVRTPTKQPKPIWFDARRRLRAESFTSPLASWSWRPELGLTQRLLHHVPYVVALQADGRVQHAFDLRTVDDVRPLAHLMRDHRENLLPATGSYACERAHIPAQIARVPFAGQRWARSTRKRFQLHTPGGRGDTTVEGVAAQILRSKGYTVESPRILVALYRLLIGEVIAHWWRDPQRFERIGSPTHYPPGVNPLQATLLGLDAVAQITKGAGPETVHQISETVIKKGARPPTYRRYTNRLVHLADAMGPKGLAGVLEGILRGHGAHHADLVATHPALAKPLLVEVKSTGDRLRPTQAEAALYHERDARAAYRIMRIEHTDADQVWQ